MKETAVFLLQEVHIQEVLLLGFLFAAAWVDYKTKAFPLWFLLVGAAVGLCLRMGAFFVFASLSAAAGGVGAWGKDLLLSFLPGVLLLLVTKVSRQQVGAGDGLLLLAAGTFLRSRFTWGLFLASLFIAAIVSVGLLLGKKKGRKQAVAFAPFVLAGYIGTLALGG